MIENNRAVTIYRPQRGVIGGGLTGLGIILVLTISTFLSGKPITQGQVIGLSIFWVMGVALTVLPFGFKLEVGDGYVKSYFLGFCIWDVRAADVQVIMYRGLMVWGSFGYGKGLIFQALVNGKTKTYRVGENFYGKEAVAHAKGVLERREID